MNSKYQWNWSANGQTFDTKYKAILEAYRHDQYIYFNEPQEYKQLSSHAPVEGDWDDVLKEWCTELRETYPYLRLYFSGGCDSKTILDAFITHGIHLDEILVAKSGIKEYDTELDDVAVPYLKKIKHKIPNTKITVEHPTWEEYQQVLSDPYWYEKINIGCNPCLHMTSIIKDRYLNLQDGSVNLYGKEKPRIVFKNGEWWTYFIDIAIEPENSQSDSRINFFVDNPVIHFKQAHMLKTAIEENFQVSEYNSIQTFSTEEKQRVWNEGCGRLLYDKKFIPKQEVRGSIFWNSRNLYFTSHKEKESIKAMIKTHPELVELWNNSMEELSLLADGEYFHQGRPELQTRGCVSNFYSLNSNKTATVYELFPSGFKID